MGLEPKQAASIQAEHLTGGTLGPGAECGLPEVGLAPDTHS